MSRAKFFWEAQHEWIVLFGCRKVSEEKQKDKSNKLIDRSIGRTTN